MRTKKVSVYLMAILLLFSITSKAFGSSTIEYAYDELNRLTTATYDAGTVIECTEYNYDETGNRLTEIVAATLLTVPGAPTGVSATAANAQATVTFMPRPRTVAPPSRATRSRQAPAVSPIPGHPAPSRLPG